MKRRHLIVLLLILCAAAVVIAIAIDPASRVRGWIASEPFFQGRSATAWRHDLRHSDDAKSAAAVAQLVAGKNDAAPICVWLLRTAPEPEARWRAADALRQMGNDTVVGRPELVAALSDPDPLVRGVAIRAVGELAPNMPGAVQSLIRLFPNVEAIRAVSRFSSAGAEAVPRLIELLEHDESTVRWQSARTLGKIGEPALAAVAKLIRLIGTDPESLVREHAAEALGDIGPTAAAGIPALVKALKDPVTRVRRDAVRALGQMGPAAIGVLAEVQSATQDSDADVKTAATRAVRLIEVAAKRKT